MNTLDFLNLIEATPMAMIPERLAALHRMLLTRRGTDEIDAGALSAALQVPEAAARANPRASGSVVVYPVSGMIWSHAPEWLQRLGLVTAPERLAADVTRLVSDPNVKCVILDVNSPGGSTAGVAEAAAEIRAARGTTPIVAVSNSVMASAAYDLGAAADEVIASPSSLTGSIGVWMAHEDWSKAYDEFGVKVTLISAGKWKTIGNEYEPLSEEAKARLQVMVDGYYEAFLASVAKSRGVTPAAVRGGYGEGDVLRAEQAVKAGLADRVASLNETIARFGGAMNAAAGTRAEVEHARARLEMARVGG